MVTTLLADAVSSGNPLIDWIVSAGPIGILAVIILLFLRGDIVPRSTYDAALKREERLAEYLYKQVDLGNRAVDVSMQRLELDEKIAELRGKGGP